MTSQGYLEGVRVCEELEKTGQDAELIFCLQGLKSSEQGQERLSKGDFDGVLKYSIEAESIFSKIPEAKYLLAICKADISAAYGGLKNYEQVARYAKEAIALVEGYEMLIFTEGTAYMNLGMAQVQLDQAQAALSSFEKAYNLLKKAPNGTRYLDALRNNIEILKETKTDSAPASSGCMVSVLFIFGGFLGGAYLLSRIFVV